MANEIRVGANLRWDKPDSQSFIERKFSNKTFDQTPGTSIILNVQNFDTTAAGVALVLGDLVAGTFGWAFFYNHSATDTVEVGNTVAAAFHEFLMLEPLEFAVLRLSTGITSLTGRAVANTVDLEYFIIEN